MKKTKNIPLENIEPYTNVGEPIKILTTNRMERQRVDRIKSWVTFYRNNPSFFVEHYLGIPLYHYQKFWLNLMAHSTDFLALAARASAKSWLIAVYSVTRCILYPKTTVALLSSTKSQAGLIISEKCTSLLDSSPMLRREYSSIVTNQNKWEMKFKNGSKINVVISGEGGRGWRSNVTVLEERRLIPTAVIDSVIRPFAISRQPPYMKNIKYKDIPELQEEALEITITSAYYKSHEWWKEAKEVIRSIANGDKDTKAIFLDYRIALHHKIKTKKQMRKEKRKLDPITFMMEYENIPYGSSDKSFYKLNLFIRSIQRSWRPITDEIFITTKKNPYDIPKTSSEIRVVSVDVATRAGKANDNTVITCARLFPTRRGWEMEVCYIESHNGKRTDIQALRIKQIYEEFKADALVLDVANAGIGVFDALSSLTKDENRGVEYKPYTVMPSPYIDDKVYQELGHRTLGSDAIPCIFPITANQQLNSIIAIKFRERLKKRLVRFLIDDAQEEEFLIKSKNTDILDVTDSGVRAYLLQAHVQTSLLINECISLEMVPANGYIKLEEPSGARKDRYTSCSYLNYYVSLLDIDLLKEGIDGTDEDEFLGVTQIY